MNNTQRMYNFAPFYLSSIQQGIQAAHSQVQLVHSYYDDPITERWINEPTTICLNGGNSSMMHELLEFLEHKSTLPWGAFNEDQDSLEGLLTNICVLVPARVYMAYDELVKNKKYKFEHFKNCKIVKYTKTFKTLDDLFHSADPQDVGTTVLNPINAAYNTFKEQYGELNVFEILLADKLRDYKLAN